MTIKHKPRIQPVNVALKEPLRSKMETFFPAALPSPNLYRSVARNESLFIDMIDMGFIGPTGLMDRKTIPPRRRELLILRTCMQARNEYEFHLHERCIRTRCQTFFRGRADRDDTIDWPVHLSRHVGITNQA